MSKLTVTTTHAILSKGQWTADGKMRLQCTHNTEELLKRSGITKPRPLESYEIKVRRAENGMLALNPYASRSEVIASESTDELTAIGGIFYDAKTQLDEPATAQDCSKVFSEILGRTFEFPVDPHRKVRFVAVSYQDESLPSPGEKEDWKPKKATDEEIRSCAAKIASPDLTRFEK